MKYDLDTLTDEEYELAYKEWDEKIGDGKVECPRCEDLAQGYWCVFDCCQPTEPYDIECDYCGYSLRQELDEEYNKSNEESNA